jgi:hypothetical protein
VVGSFDEFAILESGTGADEREEVGAPTVARLELAGRGLAHRSLAGPLSWQAPPVSWLRRTGRFDLMADLGFF